MWHKPCRTFHPWCLCIKTRCLYIYGVSLTTRRLIALVLDKPKIRQKCRNCALLWRHNGRGSVSNHQPHDCLLNRWFRRRSKKTSKLCVTGLCAGNSPGTGEFPAQMASNAENVSIWWRHHGQFLVPVVKIKLLWNVDQHTNILSKNMQFKMSSANQRSFCLGFNMLTPQ